MIFVRFQPPQHILCCFFHLFFQLGRRDDGSPAAELEQPAEKRR